MGNYRRGGRSGGRSGSRPFQQPAPKPFDFVSLPNRVARKKPIGHEQYHSAHLTGQLQGTLEALSPLHIGSGIIELGQDVELIKTVVRTGGRVVIPGSSLKGAIRSVAEAISESCVCKASEDAQHALPRDFRECRQKERLCIACRIFGAMGFQGNVAIQDAPYIHGQIVTAQVPQLYPPRPRRGAREVPGRKFYMHGQVASGRTPVEACDVGSKFRFITQVDNLTQAEWGLLLTALGQHPDYPFKLKIGGVKPVCFGSMDIQIEQIQLEDQARDRYLAWDVRPEAAKTGAPLETWIRDCIAHAADSLIVQDLLEDLAQILRHPNQRNCPSRSY